jgi:hypothetical protein
MAKDREKSDILTIVPPKEDVPFSEEIAIDALLKQHKELLNLVEAIEGDLKSLGHKFDETT